MTSSMENIRGNIDQYGKPTETKISKLQQNNRVYFNDKELLTKPTCDTLKNILVYTNWILFVVLVAMLIGMFGDFPAGVMLFLTLIAIVLITYAAFINMRWPDMVECARIKMLKEDRAIKKTV